MTNLTSRHPDTHQDWQVGVGRRKLTPEIPVWLAGYGYKREPEGKIHDLWVKVLAFGSPEGKRAVLVTMDQQGMSKTIYERLAGQASTRFGIGRADFMLTFSHTHSGPCLEDDLQDYYPADAAQKEQVLAYSRWMEARVLEAVGEALGSMQEARIDIGEGFCPFAVNRRENAEADVPGMREQGIPLKGVVDHSVPVMAVRNKAGGLCAVLFGYACHPTTLNGHQWCGDYPGFAQLDIEAAFPGATALFFNTGGGDQNPLPRRTVPLCAHYGKMLSDAVAGVLEREMTPVSAGLATAFRWVDLAYEKPATRETLLPVAGGPAGLQARWAARMLDKLAKGEEFAAAYPYPVQAWQLGSRLLLIGIGGEAVVDYALRLRAEYAQGTTWLSGYTNEMAAYIPSRRIWEEGGYEGAHIDEYGHPAWRWDGDVEDRVMSGIRQVVTQVRSRINV